RSTAARSTSYRLLTGQSHLGGTASAVYDSAWLPRIGWDTPWQGPTSGRRHEVSCTRHARGSLLRRSAGPSRLIQTAHAAGGSAVPRHPASGYRPAGGGAVAPAPAPYGRRRAAHLHLRAAPESWAVRSVGTGHRGRRLRDAVDPGRSRPAGLRG